MILYEFFYLYLISVIHIHFPNHLEPSLSMFFLLLFDLKLIVLNLLYYEKANQKKAHIHDHHLQNPHPS
jgi:hypothetical protein